jgi:hypothetical protein
VAQSASEVAVRLLLGVVEGGLRLDTLFVETEILCRYCQTNWQPPIAKFVNVKTDPDARLGILIGTMHSTYCPYCKKKTFIDTTFEYYDPDQSLLVQIRPAWEFKAGGGEEWYLKRFEDLVMKYSETDVRVDVVFGFDEMIGKYLGGEQAVAEAHEEWERRKQVAAAEREQKLGHAAFHAEEPDEVESDERPA